MGCGVVRADGDGQDCAGCHGDDDDGLDCDGLHGGDDGLDYSGLSDAGDDALQLLHCNSLHDKSQDCAVVYQSDNRWCDVLCGGDDDQMCDGHLFDVEKTVSESDAENFETMSDIFSHH